MAPLPCGCPGAAPSTACGPGKSRSAGARFGTLAGRGFGDLGMWSSGCSQKSSEEVYSSRIPESRINNLLSPTLPYRPPASHTRAGSSDLDEHSSLVFYC